VAQNMYCAWLCFTGKITNLIIVGCFIIANLIFVGIIVYITKTLRNKTVKGYVPHRISE
jgi:hypothetical protein